MTRIELRRGTASEWAAVDPILAAGEPGFETDTGKLKLGNGTTPWSQLPAFLNDVGPNAAYGGWENVKAHGAKGDRTTNDAAAIQAAIDSMPNGGRLYFPPGIYNLAGSVIFSRPCVVEGAARTSANDVYGTTILAASETVTPFVVNSDHVTVRDLAFRSNATPAATNTGQHSAIKFTSGNFCTVERCRFARYYTQIWIEVGYGWMISECTFFNPAKYSMLVRDVGAVDSGDQVLHSNQFAADMTTWVPDAAVRYESGGGMKVQHNKFTDYGIGLDLAIAANSSTSVMTINGNSFENQHASNIRLGRAGTTGTFNRINIAGNQFSSNLCSDAAIRVNTGISEVMVASNIMWGRGGSGGTILIRVAGADNVAVMGNSLRVAAYGIQIDAGSSDVRCSDNKFRDITTPIYDLTEVYYANKALAEHRYQLGVVNVTSTTVFTNLFQIFVKDRGACEIRLTITGRIEPGVSGFAVKQQRLAARLSSNAAVTLSTVGTDGSAGPAIAVNYDTTSMLGVAIVQVRRDSTDGGTAAGLTATLEVVGGGCERVVLP